MMTVEINVFYIIILGSFAFFGIVIIFSIPQIKKILKEKRQEREFIKEENENLLLMADEHQRRLSKLEQELDKRRFQPKDFLTPKENDFFKSLVCSKIINMEFSVNPQVAMSAIIDAKITEDREHFDKKRVDFLICTKRQKPICVIELDGTSHNNTEFNDQERDNMLLQIGIPTLRYKNDEVVSPEKIKRDIIAGKRT